MDTSTPAVRRARGFALAAGLALLLGAMGGQAAQAEPGITTDALYLPGDVARVFGYGFAAGEQVEIEVTAPDGTVATQSAQASSKGTFWVLIPVDAGGEHTVEALDEQTSISETPILVVE